MGQRGREVALRTDARGRYSVALAATEYGKDARNRGQEATMKNFGRALRFALNYRLTLVGALLSAVAVAVFWGGNIGALYPIVEVAFRGRSLQEWVDQEIGQAENQAAELETALAARQQTGTGASGEDPAVRQRELEALRVRWQAEQRALATLRWLQPKIHRFVPSDPFQTIVAIVAVLMLATAAKNCFIFSHHMLLQRLIQLVTFDLRKGLHHHMLRMDLTDFEDQQVGSLMSRFNLDLNHLARGLNALLGKAVLQPLKGIACLVGAAIISWRLLLFSLLLTPIAGLLIRSLAGSIKRANRRAMEENSQLMGVLSEACQGIQTVKAFTMEGYERHRFHRVSKEYLRKSMRIALYSTLIKPTTEILGLAVIFIALIAGAHLVLNQQTHLWGLRLCDRPLSVPALMSFYAMLLGASDPARRLSDVFSEIQAGVAAADRLFPLLDRRPEITDPKKPRLIPQPFLALHFDHVDFHYREDQPVLQDIDLSIRGGETLCIVGPNGCGKSTLISLLPRFHDPVSGSVRIDDVDLRQVRLRELRRLVAVVTQQTLLFDDTVYNNIRYGSLQATAEQVYEAARRAHADRFIQDQLDDGYQTVVGCGGGRLSGGQRQRIALARAILRDPRVLILDEATSQIDLESEQLIHRALQDFVRDRTAIMITHRLSTLELADRILVLDAGRIVDLGTHAELIRRCKLYRRLHDIQLRIPA